MGNEPLTFFAQVTSVSAFLSIATAFTAVPNFTFCFFPTDPSALRLPSAMSHSTASLAALAFALCLVPKGRSLLPNGSGRWWMRHSDEKDVPMEKRVNWGAGSDGEVIAWCSGLS